jgi:hypothetical protein
MSIENIFCFRKPIIKHIIVGFASINANTFHITIGIAQLYPLFLLNHNIHKIATCLT